MESGTYYWGAIIVGFVLHACVLSKSKVTKGYLNGNILLKKFQNGGLKSDGIGVQGSKVELHENYVIVSNFAPKDKNKSKTVYSWDDIYFIPIE